MPGKFNTKPRLVPTSKANGKGIGLYIDRYPPIEKIQFDPMKVSTSKDKEILSLLGKIRKPTFEGQVKGKIEKWFLPIDLSSFSDMGRTVVDGALKVDKHRHPGTMFTVIVSGSLTINGTKLSQGDWFLVPPGSEYEVESATGYESVFSYHHSC